MVFLVLLSFQQGKTDIKGEGRLQNQNAYNFRYKKKTTGAYILPSLLSGAIVHLDYMLT